MVKIKTKSRSSRSPIMTMVHVVFGCFLWIVVMIPAILLITLPLALLRWTHHILAKFLCPDLIPLGSLADCLIILNPSVENRLGNCMQVWKLKGKLSISEFRCHFENQFLSTPKLREIHRNLYCYFEKWGLYIFKRPVEYIDLKEQIKEMQWDYERYANQADTSDEEQLDMFIGKWMSTNDYGETPNWRILLIKLEKTKDSVLLFKLDHGLADGYTMVHLVDKLGGVQSPYLVKDHDFSLFTKLKFVLGYPAYMLEYCIKILSLKKVPLPNHTPSKTSTVDEEWMISFTTLDLDSVKKVRRVTKSHFNTVLGAIHVGALRRYCLETKDPAKFPEECFLPAPAGWPRHPAMSEGTMTNHLTFGGVFIPFKESDPLKRLLEAEANHMYSVDLGFGIANYWLFLSQTWPSPPALTLLVFKFTAATGLYPGPHFLTPLMCSSQNYQILGLPVERLTLPVHIPWTVRPSHLYMVPISNCGRLDISVNGTKKIFKTQKDLDRFTKVYLKEELDSLLSAVVSSPLLRNEFVV